MLALQGIKQAIADTDTGHGFRFVTAGSGALWVAALDEQLWRSLGADYKRLRDAEAPAVHGFVLVRHAIMHGAIVVTQDGLTAPLTFPIVGGPQWVPLDKLLEQWEPDNLSKPWVQQRLQSYREHLTGRGLGTPLRAVVTFFERLERADWEPENYGRPEQA
jgi:heme A synthase